MMFPDLSCRNEERRFFVVASLDVIVQAHTRPSYVNHLHNLEKNVVNKFILCSSELRLDFKDKSSPANAETIQKSGFDQVLTKPDQASG